jgi:XisH protein
MPPQPLNEHFSFQLTAERGTEKIAVEIKRFTRPSDMKDLEAAIGQFVLYDRMLKRYYPEHTPYLAVPEEIGVSVFEEAAGQTLIEDGTIQVVTFDAEQEVIVRWMP